ncbi:MAG: sulfite exporter TauE/SafE family protein [Spirochaetales bacterium]|nr:sulfite exporter TauE/SafE family protein [Spirochaetales bacterium]
MESSIKTAELRVGGMSCANCALRIERGLRAAAGIRAAEVNYGSGIARVEYESEVISPGGIITLIAGLGYTASRGAGKGIRVNNLIGTLIIILALYVLLQRFGFTGMFTSLPLAETGMGYGMLFVIGLLTSVHCLAMCGGINLSQCIPHAARSGAQRLSALRPGFLYNAGRVVSYTLVGAIVGGLGSVVSFSGGARGIVQLAAGAFMIIMGLNMLGIPFLRRLAPRMPKIFSRKLSPPQGKRSGSPLYVGLLNGLMPCGPLQAMQIYALSTGDPLKGAAAMLMFSLGTVPLMFGLGTLSSILSKRFTGKIMHAGAILVVVLGLSMLSSGFSLSGISFGDFDFSGGSPAASAGAGANSVQTSFTKEGGVQLVRTTLSSGRYQPITVEAGTPVRWTITAPQGSINGCNNRMYIPEYNIQVSFKPGDNVVEFTPAKTGRFAYSCWMGMIRSSITVVEPGSLEGSAAALAPEAGPEAQESLPAGYEIPTDAVAVAEIRDGVQYVTIDIGKDRFLPAVVVVQKQIDAKWNINNISGSDAITALLFPAFETVVPLREGPLSLYLNPADDFDFSTDDFSFYGYVKVVDDINALNIEEIKKEVSGFETLIWDYTNISADSGSSRGGCCRR